MKKFFTLLLAVGCMLSANATVFSFTSLESVNQTSDGYSVSIAKGSSNNAPAYYDNGLRLYAGNTITVTGSDLKNISITFAKQGQKDYADLTASTGTLASGGTSTSATDLKTDLWTGTASSVTFTVGTGQRLIIRLEINGSGSTGGNTPSEPSEPDTPSNPGSLNPDYVYAEPTAVNVPDMTVQGDSYYFIDNNVMVSCTKGAVNSSYFSVHAGFDMTFTATKAIKGIVINGFVKKEFTATSSAGKISYLTPDEDTEGNPVVVLTDVNATSVTLSCVKQLRCYSVQVYFDANPEATVSGGSGSTGSGQVVDMKFDTADAVYEAEFSDYFGELNYSIYLYNQADPGYTYFALDLYPAVKDQFAGTYSWDDYTLGDYTYYSYGPRDEDLIWVDGGSVTITKSGNVYTISGKLLGENGDTYNISYTGEMPIFTDEEYYGDGDTDGVDGVIEEVRPDSEEMFDLMGRRVSEDYRGLYIKGGRKYIGR